MRLELNIVDIKNVQFAGSTAVNDGVLSINQGELRELLKEDARLGDIKIELALPEEKCRITRVSDAVEPRAKVGVSGIDFPGAIGKQGTVGHGGTCVLRGACVLTSDCFPASGGRRGRAGGVGGGGAGGSIVDMWGPGAQVSPYGKTCNVVILPSPSNGVSQAEYQLALKLAGLKTAVYLAKAGANQIPDEVEVYEMDPLVEAGDSQRLPRVAYIFLLFSNQQLALPGDPVFYGDNIDGVVPTIIHPNEVLDGAITARAIDTYLLQHHPIIKGLYQRHTKSLNFVGVIVTNAPNNGPAIERAANIVANQAKWILGADGVILTKYGGGAPEMTMAAMAQKCEQLGVRTALAIQHAGMDTTVLTSKATTLFSDMPEVNAIVSLGTGGGGPNLTLPAAERVIGLDGSQAAGEGIRQVNQIKGATSLIGNSRLMTVRN